ncbi:MAG TPA: hypothetical protein VFL59_08100 [Candidatus Nanopelagicales bacterium]|nr:hypothetical protein [Candidatus Nanopelagicales bacterium]
MPDATRGRQFDVERLRRRDPLLKGRDHQARRDRGMRHRAGSVQSRARCCDEREARGEIRRFGRDPLALMDHDSREGRRPATAAQQKVHVVAAPSLQASFLERAEVPDPGRAGSMQDGTPEQLRPVQPSVVHAHHFGCDELPPAGGDAGGDVVPRHAVLAQLTATDHTLLTSDQGGERCVQITEFEASRHAATLIARPTVASEAPKGAGDDARPDTPEYAELDVPPGRGVLSAG